MLQIMPNSMDQPHINDNIHPKLQTSNTLIKNININPTAFLSKVRPPTKANIHPTKLK